MTTAVTSPDHALLVGRILGALLHGDYAYDARPGVDDAGNYTADITVDAPSGRYTVTVTPHEGG